jgi:hypothetical protein
MTHIWSVSDDRMLRPFSAIKKRWHGKDCLILTHISYILGEFVVLLYPDPLQRLRLVAVVNKQAVAGICNAMLTRQASIIQPLRPMLQQHWHFHLLQIRRPGVSHRNRKLSFTCQHNSPLQTTASTSFSSRNHRTSSDFLFTDSVTWFY